MSITLTVQTERRVPLNPPSPLSPTGLPMLAQHFKGGLGPVELSSPAQPEVEARVGEGKPEG